VRDEDFVECLFTASTHDYMLFFTDRGRCYWQKVYEIPEGSYTARGRSIANLVEMDKNECTRSYAAVREFSEDRYVFFVTREGKVKRTSLAAFANPRRKGIIAMNIAPKDELVGTMLTSGKDDVLLVTHEGMGVRFKETAVRDMGRTAAGVRGVTVKKGDRVVGCVLCDPERSLLVVTEKGLGKRTEFDLFPVRNRGGKGVIAAKLVGKSGKLAAARSVSDRSEVIIMTRNAAVIRIKMADVKKLGRATTGVKLMDVKKGDTVVDVAHVES